MSKSAGLIARLFVPAFFVAGVIAGPAMAQEKAKSEAPKASLKVLLENDKVRVYEAHIPAGAEAANIARPYRIGRALTSATIQRIYPDGKKETVQWKAGEVKELGPNPQYIPRNIGKTDFRIYVVEPKSK
jgi:hypothetical protein